MLRENEGEENLSGVSLAQDGEAEEAKVEERKGVKRAAEDDEEARAAASPAKLRKLGKEEEDEEMEDDSEEEDSDDSDESEDSEDSDGDVEMDEVEEDEDEEVEEGDVRGVLQRLRLTKIIKENHYSSVVDVVYNTVDARCSNVMASTGANQINMYDGRHFGDFMDVFCHYVHGEVWPKPQVQLVTHDEQGDRKRRSRVKYTAMPDDHPQRLNSLAWMAEPPDHWLTNSGQPQTHPKPEEVQSGPHFDSLLAAASNDGYIHVLSMAWTRVIARLDGVTHHNGKPVTFIATCPSAPDRLLLSFSAQDESLCIWHVKLRQGGGDLVAKIENLPALHAAWHPSKTDSALVCLGGSSRADHPRREVLRSVVEVQWRENEAPTVRVVVQAVANKELVAVDVVSEETILVLWNDGILAAHAFDSGALKAQFQVPDYEPTETSPFCMSQCKRFVVAGNGDGDLFVFDLDDADMDAAEPDLQPQKPFVHLEHNRSRGAITSVAISPDSKSIVASNQDGFIWRWLSGTRGAKSQADE